MELGILKETNAGETRVPLIPYAVGELVRHGNRVVLEAGAGAASGFDDPAYEKLGATIAYSPDEVRARSRAVLQVYPPSFDELQKLDHGQVLLSFLHLSHATRRSLELLIERRITAIGFEAIETADGDRPVLTAMSEIAGRLVISIAAHHLQAHQGGRGTLLEGVPGVPPGTVVILGAGTVGTNAALRAVAAGAQVMVLDRDVARLRALEARGKGIATATASPYNIRRFVPIADVLIGAVLIGLESTPHLIDENLIARMRPGSVFLDVSIDQGGCSTTSRPTTMRDPVYVSREVIHYCVPNIPALVPRTSTVALSNILLPYILELAHQGPHKVLQRRNALSRGFYTHDGTCLRRKIAEAVGLPMAGTHEEVHEHAGS